MYGHRTLGILELEHTHEGLTAVNFRVLKEAPIDVVSGLQG